MDGHIRPASGGCEKNAHGHAAWADGRRDSCVCFGGLVVPRRRLRIPPRLGLMRERERNSNHTLCSGRARFRSRREAHALWRCSAFTLWFVIGRLAQAFEPKAIQARRRQPDVASKVRAMFHLLLAGLNTKCRGTCRAVSPFRFAHRQCEHSTPRLRGRTSTGTTSSTPAIRSDGFSSSMGGWRPSGGVGAAVASRPQRRPGFVRSCASQMRCTACNVQCHSGRVRGQAAPGSSQSLSITLFALLILSCQLLCVCPIGYAGWLSGSDGLRKRDLPQVSSRTFKHKT